MMNFKCVLFFVTFLWFGVIAEKKPNIVWICIEDASTHIGSYGETAIKTPVMDQMAMEGIKFNKAFVVAPVCSSSRSAMVTGMFQMTTGFHHHRSQRLNGKGSGNKSYYDSYLVPQELLTVPELFKKAGYYVTNKSKTDYNFVRSNLYDSSDWTKRRKGQPFFAQFQLHGGKNRKSKAGVDFAKMKLPPYYANTAEMRNDWAQYLGSWVQTDKDVDKILKSLKKAGELENTYVFLWTDHGVSHIRGKQFLYDEGIQVPLIVRFPNKKHASSVRQDLVTHIDIPVSSLALAGLDRPAYMQGKNIFADSYSEQQQVFCGRDRCDETVDIIRCVRTQKYKYIRNFLPDVSHMQPSQYKDAKSMIKYSRELYKSGKLNELQARPFLATRPIEELYDLEKDPFETKNLATNSEYTEIVGKLRTDLKNWMINTKDLGLIPEPILEEKGRKYGNKYSILKSSENKTLVSDLLEIIEAGEKSDVVKLKAGLKSTEESIRYWSARALGVKGIGSLKVELSSMLQDKNATVRIAVAESMYRLGDERAVEVLKKEVANPNLLVGMYALRAIESLAFKTKGAVAKTVKSALKSKYEFSKRIAKRLTSLWEL
jgi:arylsulfatase A-like enzyme